MHTLLIIVPIQSYLTLTYRVYVVFLSICTFVYVDVFHRDSKYLKVLEKKNTTVLFWNLQISLTLSYKNSMFKISFNLYFRVCWRLPSGFQIFKGTGEKQYDSAFLKSIDFPNCQISRSYIHQNKVFGDYTPLCIIAELFCLALCKHRSLLNTTNSIGVFPLSSCFIMPNIHWIFSCIKPCL